MPDVTKGKMTPIEPSIIARVAGVVRDALLYGAQAQRHLDQKAAEQSAASPAGTEIAAIPERPKSEPQAISGTVTSDRRDSWFGAGNPLKPVAPFSEVAGRAFDFRTGVNLDSKPRAQEGVSFETLRTLADTYDLLRLCIETRKDQVSKVTWSIGKKHLPGEKFRRKSDETCRRVEQFLKRPDGIHSWYQWVRMLAEDMLVLDAVAIYRRKKMNGELYALELVDPATIKILIDHTGRRPLPPAPAYQQILKGVPAVDYTADELYYGMQNPRSNRIYGLSVVEQIITYVNIGLRRMAGQMSHFTEGNVPDALMAVPESWTPTQIAEFQKYWDMLLSDQSQRRKMRFIPGGSQYFPTRPDGGLTDQFDEWLARIVCYAFSLPPFPFVRMQNRATAQTALETALEEGLQPFLIHIKQIVDDQIQGPLGAPDCELVWDDVRKIDPAEQQQLDIADIRMGIKSIDEVKASRGEEPLGLPNIMFGVGPMGFMTIEDMKRAIEQGLTMPQPQMPPDAMGLGSLPTDPNADPFADAPPGLLQHFGLARQAQALPASFPANQMEDGEDDGEEGTEEDDFTQALAKPSRAQKLRAALKSRNFAVDIGKKGVKQFTARLLGGR